MIEKLTQSPQFAQVEVLFMTTQAEAIISMPPDLGEFETTDTGVLFRCKALRLDWIAALLLSLDFPIRIIQPDALRDEFRTLAQKARTIIDT